MLTTLFFSHPTLTRVVCIRLRNKKKTSKCISNIMFLLYSSLEKKLNYQIETLQNTAKKKVSNKLLSRKPQNQGKTTFSKYIRSAVLIILAFPVYQANFEGCPPSGCTHLGLTRFNSFPPPPPPPFYIIIVVVWDLATYNGVAFI